MKQLWIAGAMIAGIAVLHADQQAPEDQLIADEKPNLYDRQAYPQDFNGANYYYNQNYNTPSSNSSSYYYSSPAQSQGNQQQQQFNSSYYNYNDSYNESGR